MFYAGTLQEGITAAVQQAKAVVCFVKDDNEASSTWEEEYFTGDEELTRLIQTKAVPLRITKDSPEAGFLASVCPVSQYPTVVVIKNGMLREYLVPEISQEDFCKRLTTVLNCSNPQTTQQDPLPVSQNTPQSHDVGPSASDHSGPATTTSRSATDAVQQPVPHEQPSQSQRSDVSAGKRRMEQVGPSSGSKKALSREAGQPKEAQRPDINVNKKVESVEGVKKPVSSSATLELGKSAKEPTKSSTSIPPGAPSQYRLQVRLFDGRSVRSSFSPSQTLRKDVRPWLDGQMVEEKRPYKLKHILTPLPNHTLNITEEEQTLRELIVGSTATFVMVPIQSYSEAYSSVVTGLPARALSSAYGLVSSAASMASGLIGSVLGYGQATPSEPAPEPDAPTSNPQAAGNGGRRLRPFASSGPNIRTLRDQQNEQDRNEFYNGNQLNFEPRADDDGK